MKTLQIDEKKARGLYKTATPEFKAALEDTFGKDFFTGSITDRVKSYEDACEELGINPNHLPDVSLCMDEDKAAIIAQHKLCIITRALNEGWKPNWKNSNQIKYFPWFDLSSPSGFAFLVADDWRSRSGAGGGSRLCFPSEALARYAGKQFIDLYRDLMIYQ